MIAVAATTPGDLRSAASVVAATAPENGAQMKDSELAAILEWVESHVQRRLNDLTNRVDDALGQFGESVNAALRAQSDSIVDGVNMALRSHAAAVGDLACSLAEVREIAQPLEMTKVLRNEIGDLVGSVKVHTDGQAALLAELLRR